MGGRGKKLKHFPDGDSWQWLQDVNDDRLQNYIKRSNYLADKKDPQGRSIHDVAFHAERELKRRRGE
jgi:hypothetical protein